MEAPIPSVPVSLLPIDTPPGPNVDLSADQGPRIIGVAAFLMVISGIIVSLRFTARYLSTAGIWWDDWLALGAMLVAWGCCICGFIVPAHGFGRHEAALGPQLAVEDTMIFFKVLYAYQTLYTIAITLAKASIIVFYGRIFTERSFQRALWIVSGFVALWYVVVQITQFAECRPLHALWDGTSAEHCIDLIKFFLAAGAVNCVLNFVLLVMPLPMVWSLDIGRQAKIGLSLTFLLGAFVFAVSVARLGVLSGLENIDVTWTYVNPAIWNTVEPVIAVVSASLPILRSLWVLLRPQSSAQNSAKMRSNGSRRYEKQVNFVDTPKTFDGKPEYSKGRSPGPDDWADPEAGITVKRTDDESPTPIWPAISDLKRTYTTKSDLSGVISPLSERSMRRSQSYDRAFASNLPSSSGSRTQSAERSRSLISKFSPMIRTPLPLAGGASPDTERSGSPQTIEMNRLPIQGGNSGKQRESEMELDIEWEDSRGRPSDRYNRSNGSSRPETVVGRLSPSRRSSQARATWTSNMTPNRVSRSSQRLKSIYAVELDAREDRRYSLKRPRGERTPRNEAF